MELEKYKVCPECEKHNPPNLLECRYCEADLTGCKVVDKASEALDASREKEAAVQTALARICECGAQNPPQARKCTACGEDISDIPAQPVTAARQKPFAYELRSTDGAFAAAMEQVSCVIGREAELKEYLSSRLYVSRHHARLTVVEGRVFIENLSATNKTFLNNEQIPDGVPTPLCDGDEIGLGGKVVGGSRQESAAYFVFRVKI